MGDGVADSDTAPAAVVDAAAVSLERGGMTSEQSGPGLLLLRSVGSRPDLDPEAPAPAAAAAVLVDEADCGSLGLTE